jgi:hypothetical protein
MPNFKADDGRRELIVEEIVGFTEAGALYGCPFCIGRTIAQVKSGDRIVFLKGSNAGRTAKVLRSGTPREELFYVRYPKAPKGVSQTCSYGFDEFVLYPLPKVPAWMCPLSIDDLWRIEDSILRLLKRSIIEQISPGARPLAKALASTVWHRRLPVFATLVFETLRHHGFRDEWQKEFVTLFDFAIDTLISNHGRPAILRKRVPPMSIGRYTSISSRAFWAHNFGFDPAVSPFRPSSNGA